MSNYDCIFCKIVSGELPATIVDEDERTVSFMDINPATRGHSLVIPRRHSRNLLEIEREDLEATIVAAQRLAGKAVDRLEERPESLTDLALELGYSSHSHFTLAFRREFGVPPSLWRRGLLGAPPARASRLPLAAALPP